MSTSTERSNKFRINLRNNINSLLKQRLKDAERKRAYRQKIKDNMKGYVNHFEWNFFATSHGKGAVDGVGAIVKRKVWQLVRAQNLILKDAHDFYRLAKSNIDGVKLIYVTENDIKTTTQYLGEKWLNIKNITGVKSHHHFSSLNENFIEMTRTAVSPKHKLQV